MRVKTSTLYRMALRELCGAAIESMTNGKDSDKKRDAYVEFLSILFAFLLAFVILGFVGKLLWNSVVVELVSVAKPAKSFWQIIGLMIFMMLLRP
jgi:hypothetical protein